MVDPSPRSGPLPVVVAEHTPNPDCVRLHLPRALGPERGVDFPAPEAARGRSPVAEALLALDGIARVYVGSDFLSVTREAGADWRALAPRVESIVREHAAANAALVPGPIPPAAASADDRVAAERIRGVLESEIRPIVERHGGEVALLSYREGIVELDLRGACAGCPSARDTLRRGIETRLREAVPEISRVIAR
jgi:Fe-S cluster biogenesis protein NfuA